MSTFVLVHGGWQSGWCWAPTVAVLQQQGHDAFTANWLPDAGQAAGDPLDATVNRAGDSVARQIEERGLSGVVLVGHSGGGPIVQRAADQVFDRIRQVVFVDAWTPHSGESIEDIVPAAEQMFKAAAEARDDRPVVVPDGWWENNLMNGGDTELASRTTRRLVPLPYVHFEDRLELQHSDMVAQPSSYILRKDDISVGDVQTYAAMAEKLPSTRVTWCIGPHEAMLTHPLEMVEALVVAAAPHF